MLLLFLASCSVTLAGDRLRTCLSINSGTALEETSDPPPATTHLSPCPAGGGWCEGGMRAPTHRRGNARRGLSLRAVYAHCAACARRSTEPYSLYATSSPERRFAGSSLRPDRLRRTVWRRRSSPLPKARGRKVQRYPRRFRALELGAPQPVRRGSGLGNGRIARPSRDPRAAARVPRTRPRTSGIETMRPQGGNQEGTCAGSTANRTSRTITCCARCSLAWT